jgi:small-conductance mechanosensitive channel
MVLSLAELLQQYIGLSQILSEIIVLALLFTLAIAVAWLGHSIFKRYLSRWAAKTKTHLDDDILRNIRAPIFLLAILFGLYYGLAGITVLQDFAQEVSLAFTVSQILVVTFIITRVANVLVAWYAQESVKRKKKVSNHILYILKRSVQVVVYIFAFLIILGLLGVELSSVVVGLGVGGIAIALALQVILSDAISAFSIYFDRPFEIGDFIVFGDYSGTVTKIGIKSTRVKLLQGEELIIPNKEITSKSVRNFKKLKSRRIVFQVKVAPETSVKKLKRIPEIITKLITKTELAKLDRVHFRQFGDFTIDFEVVYYIKTGDYNKYMDIQQQINYGILEEFEKEKIEMPYPTQKIFCVKQGEPA